MPDTFDPLAAAKSTLIGASCHEGFLHHSTRNLIARMAWLPRAWASDSLTPICWHAVTKRGDQQRTWRLSRDCSGSVTVEVEKRQGYGWQFVCNMR